MRTLTFETAKVFRPLLEPARTKGTYGGRGSGKSHFFAELMVEDALRFPGESGEGMRGICGREIQKSLKDSAKFLIESKLAKYKLGEADGFKIYTDKIETPKDGLLVFQGLQDHTSESIKSFEGFHRFWGEESHSLSTRSINLIRPTIRWENKRLGLSSELWFSWNPTRKSDAVDAMLRGEEVPTGAIVVRANWSDNPWFPDVLEQERLDCLRLNAGQYDHIWEGGYATVYSGAYFAQCLAEIRLTGNIGRVGADPHLPLKVFCDIGGTGGKSDAFAMWVCQFVGREIRVLNYYEAVGQPFGTHLSWLRKFKYDERNAQIYLPHDGSTQDRVFDVSYQSAFLKVGYDVEVIPNQGKGAAMMRIESVRKMLPSCWFNEDTTTAGIDALGWYHEKRDDDRNIGLGPEHDWSSHGSDAFGLCCIVAEKAFAETEWVEPYEEHDESRSMVGGY
jgi:phage terminase large subunit